MIDYRSINIDYRSINRDMSPARDMLGRHTRWACWLDGPRCRPPASPATTKPDRNPIELLLDKDW